MTKTLARNYDVLNPMERLGLLIKATGRADTVEMDRLVNASPTTPCNIPDYRWRWERLKEMAFLQMVRLLDTTAFYWRTLAMETEAACEGDSKTEGRLSGVLTLIVFRFLAEFESWQTFCAEHCIDGTEVFQGIPGLEAVLTMAEHARQLAPTLDEVNKALPPNFEGELATKEHLLRNLRRWFNHDFEE